MIKHFKLKLFIHRLCNNLNRLAHRIRFGKYYFFSFFLFCHFLLPLIESQSTFFLNNESKQTKKTKNKSDFWSSVFHIGTCSQIAISVNSFSCSCNTFLKLLNSCLDHTESGKIKKDSQNIYILVSDSVCLFVSATLGTFLHSIFLTPPPWKNKSF